MDEFAQLPPGERRLYFEEAAALQGITPQLIEKDFWVCWTIRKLFALDPVGEKLTFKGGTSLSKVFGLIERFSEDIDIAIEREFLGFTGDDDPLQDLSQKKRGKLLKSLTESSETLIASVLAPRLRASIEEVLPASGWSLGLADEDKQTLLFRYPQSISSEISEYFPPLVKVELGARSDHYPVEAGTIKPYVAEMLPSAIDDSETHVRVLSAARTFWEKATILHSMHHHREGFPIRRGQSRHLYDVFKIANSSVIEDTLQ